MKNAVVRYQTKPERADENQRLVEHVFEELNRTDPGGVRYVTFRLGDGVSFVHVACFDTADGPNPLNETSAFQAFVRGIEERCDQPPVAQDATIVGSYRFFEGQPAVRSS
jgi:hypothetical protein